MIALAKRLVGGQVEDPVEGLVGKRRGISHVAGRLADCKALERRRGPRVAGQYQRRDVVAGGDKLADERAPELAGGSGDEAAHVSPGASRSPRRAAG